MASRFWVGGAGTWSASNTANWAATTGGAGGASVPASGDTVTFDGNSGSGVTCTLAYSPTVMSLSYGAALMTLDLNGQVITCNSFNNSGNTVRTIAFGTSGKISLVGTGGTIHDGSQSSNFTLTGTPTIDVLGGPISFRRINGAVFGFTGNNVFNFNIIGNVDSIIIENTVGSVVFSGSTGGTLTTSTRTVVGSLTLLPTMTVSAGTLITTLSARASATSLITTAGLTLDFPVTVSAPVTSTVQLQDNLTMTATRTFTYTAGGLNFNNNNVTLGIFASSGTGTRPWNTGAGTFDIIGNNATVWALTGTGSTITGSRTVNFTYSGATGTRTLTNSSVSEAVAFNTNISAGTDTVAVTGAVTNLNTTGFAGTFSNQARTIFGNLTLSPTTTVSSGASATTFGATSGTKTVTTNGKTIDFPMTVNCPTSTVQLQDNLTMTATRTFTYTAGGLNFNNNNVTLGIFLSAGTGTRTWNTGTGTFDVIGNNATVWSLTGTGSTVTGSRTVNFTYSGAAGTRTLSNSSVGEAVAFNTNISAGTDVIVVGGTMRDLDFTGFSGTLNPGSRVIFGNFTLSTGMTVANSASPTGFANTSGTTTIDTKGRQFPQQMTFSGVGGTRRLLGNVDLGPRNAAFQAGILDLNDFTLTAFTAVSSGTSARQIQFGNTGAIDVTASGQTIWSFDTSTGFSYTGNGRVNLTYAGAVGTRTISHGSADGSLATKAPPIYITAGTDQVVVTAGSWLDNLDFTGFAGTFTNAARNIAGNLTFSAGMTASAGSFATTFNGNVGTQSITANGITIDFPVTIYSTGGDFVLGEPLVMGTTSTLAVNSGNLIANGYPITAGTFVSSNLNSRVIDISNSTVTLQSFGTVWNMSASGNATVIATGSTINLTNDTTTSRVFNGGGLTYGSLDIGGANSTSTTSFNGNSTFAGQLTSSKTVAHTVSFSAGATITVGGFGINGSAGNLVTITSMTGAPHNLVYTGAGNVDVSYANISYSNASPSTDTWFSLLTNNNIDSGNNTGWIFTDGPAPSGSNSNFFLMF